MFSESEIFIFSNDVLIEAFFMSIESAIIKLASSDNSNIFFIVFSPDFVYSFEYFYLSQKHHQYFEVYL